MNKPTILCFILLLAGCGGADQPARSSAGSEAAAQPPTSQPVPESQPSAVSVEDNSQVADTSSDLLPEYQRVSGISGNLSSSGSDTLANLMT